MKRNLYITLPAFLGFAFLIWLSASARLSYDDFLFAACFKTRSFFEAFNFLYHTHAFRWTTFLFEDLVLGIVPGEYYPISIPLFFLAFYLLWIHQLHKLIGKLLEKYFKACVPRAQSLGLGALLITGFYFSASQAVESFTSMIIVTDRLLPLLFITMSLNLFLSEKSALMVFGGLLVCAFLIAGTAENVTVTVLCALFLFLAYRKMFLKQAFPTRILFFAIVLMIFFGLENLSAGRAARYYVERTFHFTCGTDGVYCADSLGEFLRRFFLGRQLFLFPIVAIFYFFVDALPTAAKVRITSIAKKLIVGNLVMLALIAVFHFISAKWVFDCYGPMRMWLPVNLILAMLLVFVAVFYGSRAQRLPRSLSFFCGIFLSALIFFYFTRHYSKTEVYRQAYDNRIHTLKNIKSSPGVVEVPPLPEPDLVVHGDIMKDENDDVNRDFKGTYGLPFKVRTK